MTTDVGLQGKKPSWNFEMILPESESCVMRTSCVQSLPVSSLGNSTLLPSVL